MRSKRSVVIAVINIGVVALLVLLAIATPLGRQPGPIHPLLVPPFLWVVFSLVPGAIGLGYALLACIKKEPLLLSVTGLLLNGGYLAAYGAGFWFVSQL